MKNISEMTIGELGAFVCSHLKENNIICTLSGGACVSIYTENKYESLDLDFIEQISTSKVKKTKVMNEIGFYNEGRYYKHSDTPYFIEFPPGPLGIGDEIFVTIDELKFNTGVLNIIAVTDCVMDRLAGFYHWGDNQSLEQAILVARSHNVNFDKIEKWSKKERSLSKYKKFIKLLEN